jgi:hypothetical protein
VGLGEISLLAEMRATVTWAPDWEVGPAWRSVLDLSARNDRGAPLWRLAVLVVAGLLVALTRVRWLWLPFSYLVVAYLYVLSRAGAEPIRSELVGYWYGDSFRLAALLPVIGVLLCALGAYGAVLVVVKVVRAVRARRTGSADDLSRYRSGAVVGVVALAMVVSLAFSRSGPFPDSFVTIRDLHDVGPMGTLVDADEYALYETVEDVVPEGDAVIGNPWDGSALVWAVAGREAVFPHVSMRFDEPRELLAERLNRANDDPRVCQALDELGVRYALDLGPYLHGGDHAGRDKLYPGLEGLEEAGVAEVVAEVGDARLLEITACGTGDD